MENKTQYHGTRNYTDRGGRRTVIGGELLIKNGAKLTIEHGADALRPVSYMGDAGSEVSTVAALRGKLNALLQSLRDAGLMLGAPVISVSVLPVDDVAEMTVGDATGTVTLAATVSASEECLPSLQWYTATDAEGTGAQAVEGATGATYAVPEQQSAGTLYFLCRAEYEDVSADSACMAVTVNAADA